jgi:hypothetical protein
MYDARVLVDCSTTGFRAKSPLEIIFNGPQKLFATVLEIATFAVLLKERNTQFLR